MILGPLVIDIMVKGSIGIPNMLFFTDGRGYRCH